MSVTCPRCNTAIETPEKFCIKCGEKLPAAIAFTDLGLKLLSGKELRIGESSVFDCHVINRSSFPVANVELFLSSSRFAERGKDFVDHIEAESDALLEVEVELEKPGEAILYIAVNGLIEGKVPVCYKGQTRINSTQKMEIKTESDAQKVIVNIGEEAMIGEIRIDTGQQKQEAPAKPKEHWIEIPLKRDSNGEREWSERIRAKSLRECPYCSALIDSKSARCDICSAPMPSWWAKPREVLGEFGRPLPPMSCAELSIPSLDNKTFRFCTSSKVTWGRHSDRDIHILFYDENGGLDRDKSLAISKFAGQIGVEDGRAMLLNKNKFVTRFMTRHTSESVELRENEKVELRQEGALSITDLCFLDIKPFTSPRQKTSRLSSWDTQQRKHQPLQMSVLSVGENHRQRSSSFVWPDKNIESIRICRTDCEMREEHILLENSATIGSGKGCCVHIPKSGVQRSHARIIYHDGNIWFENCSNAPIKFETGTTTKHLREDAIMKVNVDCTVRFGYLETHLKIHRKRKGMEES